MPAPHSATSKRQGLPAPLRPGDRIALVAPASPFAVEHYTAACAALELAGFQPVPGKHVLQRRGYLAGSEVERAQDLIDAIVDPAIAAVVCIRGGYGSGRLLPWLPFASLKQHPKIFLGYSDITFLHLAFWQEMQWVTFHGPNLVDPNDADPIRCAQVLTGLRGEHPFVWELNSAHVLRAGVASGVLLGGNLTCLGHLTMTPYFPDLQGALLLIEDCNEQLYRLDRVLSHLRLAGIFHKISGLVLGQFRGCGEPQQLLAMVEEQVKSFDFPVVAGLPFGHGVQNDLLPLGITYSLNTYEGTLEPQMRPFAG
jgi:muramoyltetrapeptide carboxypeptidase